eukprot:11104597-Prorocentrum_lima.AAC.1
MHQQAVVHPPGSYHHHRHENWLEKAWQLMMDDGAISLEAYPNWWAAARQPTVWSGLEDGIVQ